MKNYRLLLSLRESTTTAAIPTLLCLLVIFLSFILCLIPCTLCYAGLAVSVTTGDDWAVGTTGMGVTSETSGDTWEITGSSDGYEDVYIKVDGTTWSPGATSGVDQFVLKHDVSGSWGSPITNTGNGILLKQGLAVSGTQEFDLQFQAPATGSTAGAHTLTVTLTAVNWWACGNGLAIDHVAGDVAPVTTSITYGTVTTPLSGASKCWITRNLGASQQATSVTDDTDASAGWYWQFNRKQGYELDGETRTPSTTWITSIDEDLDWQTANDPCTIELGAGWRLPTSAEWTAADSGWTDYDHTYSSVLKLHAAGHLNLTTGLLAIRTYMVNYWSSTQLSNNTSGYFLDAGDGYSAVGAGGLGKSYGFNVRCLKD